MKIPRIFILLLLLLASACTSTGPPGTLTGQVTIGPLTPVLREGEASPTPAPEVYAARQIVIYRANGTKEVARAEINPQGVYQIELPAGTYVVDLNLISDHAAGLPATIEISPGQTTRLDIDIDTGIR